jgi:hypothetical protein
LFSLKKEQLISLSKFTEIENTDKNNIVLKEQNILNNEVNQLKTKINIIEKKLKKEDLKNKETIIDEIEEDEIEILAEPTEDYITKTKFELKEYAKEKETVENMEEIFAILKNINEKLESIKPKRNKKRKHLRLSNNDSEGSEYGENELGKLESIKPKRNKKRKRLSFADNNLEENFEVKNKRKRKIKKSDIYIFNF